MTRTADRRRTARGGVLLGGRDEAETRGKVEPESNASGSAEAGAKSERGLVVLALALVSRRIVYYALGLVEIALVFRFILKLFAANGSSPFVASIYGVTVPLTEPFRGVFAGFASDGAVFEPGTLLAIAAYAVVAWLIDRLIILIASARTPG